METAQPGTLTKIWNLIPCTMARKRKILFLLAAGFLISLITWAALPSSPASAETKTSTTLSPQLDPTGPATNPALPTNSTTNSTSSPANVNNYTSGEDSQSDATITGVQTAFFTSLGPLILFTLLVLLDLWLVGVVPATLRAWRSLTSRPAGVQQLLQTLPYYLAVSRSSCQVGHQPSLLLIQFLYSHVSLLSLIQSLCHHPSSLPLLQLFGFIPHQYFSSIVQPSTLLHLLQSL